MPPEIRLSQLDAEPVAIGTVPATPPSTSTPPRSLAEMKQEQIELALKRTEGNQTRAARLLGISREQIRYRMRKFGIGPGSSHERQHRRESISMTPLYAPGNKHQENCGLGDFDSQLKRNSVPGAGMVARSGSPISIGKLATARAA